MKKLLTAMLVCLSLSALAADSPQKKKTVLVKMKDGFLSPLKDIQLRYLINLINDADYGEREIWLYPSEKGGKGVRLYAYPVNADAFFSPDEQWIAVNDKQGSTDSFVILFSRVEGVKYKRLPDPNPVARRLLEQESGIPEIWETFHHRYFDFRGWASDSKSFIMALYGHYDSDRNLDDWFCTFDLLTMKAYLTPEQKEKNKSAVHFKKSKKNQQ